MAKFEIALDAKVYPCEEWAVVQHGEKLVRVWEGLGGGLGQFQTRDLDRYRGGANIDTTAPPYVRIPPSKVGASALALSGYDATLPSYTFQANSADGTTYVYVLNGQYAFKVKRSDGTLNATQDFGAGAVCGRPAWFEGFVYIPLGATVDSEKLDVPANTGADTYTTVTGIKALAYATLQDQSTAQLVRAYSTNLVALSADGATYGSGFEIGDSTLPIATLLSSTGEIMVIKPDGPYRFDADGNSLPLQGFVGKTKDTNAYTGAMSFAHGPFVYWIHATGIYRIFGETITPVGFETERDYVRDITMTTAMITEETWLSATAWGRWLYATRGNGTFVAYIEDDGTLTWHGELVNGQQDMVALLDDGPGLNTMGVTAGRLNRIPLTPEGSPRASIGESGVSRGEVSSGGSILYSFEDFNLSDRQKQLRRAWLITEDTPGDGSFALQIAVDRDIPGTLEDVGATITTDGLTERTWTVGTNDLFYQVGARITWTTTAGYSTTNSDPRYRQFGIEARTPDVVKAVIPLTDTEANNLSGGIKGSLIALRRLQSGQRIAIREPHFNSTFNGYVVGMQETALGNGEYLAEILLERYDIA